MNAAGDKYIDLVKASDAFRQLKRDAESNLSHAYLLLSADRLGLDILADYQVSETYIRPVIQWMRQTQENLPAYVGASRTEYLEDCLNRLEEAYGSVPDYLRAAGLSERQLNRLREKLLEE